MKKKIIQSVCLLLCALLLFSGCSKERKGVPKSVILQTEECKNFSEGFDNAKYKIDHDVDKAAHTDQATVTMTAETAYATVTKEVMYSYQYQRANDIWTLTDTEKISSHAKFNESLFIKNSPWNGKKSISQLSPAIEFRYDLNIHDLDIAKNKITVTYDIAFTDGRYPAISRSTPVTLQLEKITPYIYVFYLDVKVVNITYDEPIFISHKGLSDLYPH